MMRYAEKNTDRQKLRGIRVIAVWMMLAIMIGVYRDIKGGSEVILSTAVTVEWAFYGCAFVCALGLLLHQGWARKATIVLFAFLVMWNFYMAYFLIGYAFPEIVQWKSMLYQVSPDIVRNVLLALILTNVIWPLGAILFLTHPGVKSMFSLDAGDKLMLQKLEFSEIKPG